MSCNRATQLCQATAATVGLPALEAGWAGGRAVRATCPACGNRLGSGGSCSNCPPCYPGLASSAASWPQQPQVTLRVLRGCGHFTRTETALGQQEWCQQCDDWRTVADFESTLERMKAYRLEADRLLARDGLSAIDGDEIDRIRATLTLVGEPDFDVNNYVRMVKMWRAGELTPRPRSVATPAARPGLALARPRDGLPAKASRYLAGPIIAHGHGWSGSLPEWLPEAIKKARAEQVTANPKNETATDEEACAYLYTASLQYPFNRDWAEIYMFVFSRVITRHSRLDAGQDVWAILGREPIKELPAHQQGELDRLKGWIYRQVTNHAKGETK